MRWQIERPTFSRSIQAPGWALYGGDMTQLSEETKEVVRGLVKSFSEASNRWEGQAKECALRSIIGKAEHSEQEKEQAERYYTQAKVWDEAAVMAKRLL